MTLFQADKSAIHFSASAREVYDSTGAGDTVIAALAVALGAGLQTQDAANIANISAGLVVEKVGTAIVNISDLMASLDASSFQAAQ
jgi:D-beta-D-heptose 7-phosphate kinase/D-beta-D-heptose 1-phosphate adenosyltransferase